jgi:hypothetical protein
LNQIEIVASGNVVARGAFPLEAGAQPATAVLSGSIASIAVLPFYSSRTKIRAHTTLPLGQSEHVWIVAKDEQGEIIIGDYRPPIHIKTTTRLYHSIETLKSSEKAEHLLISWITKDFKDRGSAFTAYVHAYQSSGPKATAAPIDATSGVIYLHVPLTSRSFGPGPIAFSPDHHYLYVIANDDSYGGCKGLGQCKTLLERFDVSAENFAKKTVALPDVPGVSQLYVTSDGALWMATFQPAGSWSYPLPAYHLSGSWPPSPQPLPTGSFGEPSGFTADGSGNLWISGCQSNGQTSSCKQNHTGTPVLVETSIQAYQGVEATVQLNAKCMHFGYFGFSVGDVAIYKNDLYVLGVNDGSAPPARGTIWQVSPTTLQSLCPTVPKNFNPEPYLSNLSNSTGTPVLVFGVGNNANFRWFPNHGFYILTETGSGIASTIWDNGPNVTANHVSASSASSAPSGILYYASSGKLDLRFSGLGTYAPAANPTASPGSQWNIFPSASFSGDESDNGVAADVNGAWYTANGVCGRAWSGVCLAHALYLQASWGALPGLNLETIAVGNSTGAGVIVNPLTAHSGPFFAQTSPSSVCSPQPVSSGSDLTFTINGLSPGACQITIQQENSTGKVVSSQALVTNVK